MYGDEGGFSPNKRNQMNQYQQFMDDIDEVQYQSELVNMLQGQGNYPNQIMNQDFSNQYASQFDDNMFAKGFDDSQFQPPIDNFGISVDPTSSSLDQNFIDQKIMQNIQKYLSGVMGSQMQQQIPQQLNQSQYVTQFANQSPIQPQQQNYMTQENTQLPLNQTVLSDFQKLSLNNTLRFNETQPLNLTNFKTQTNVPAVQQQQVQVQVQQKSIPVQPPVQQLLISQLQKQQQSTQQKQLDQTSMIQSDEFVLLKQVIDGLNGKIDSMQKLTENLKLTIEQKDREINKIRSIYSMRGKKSEIVEAKNKKIKRDMGIQTVINLLDNKTEYETFSYLYDKDQDLIRSEKGQLLKYLRKEVVQNQEFLDRVNELEQINQSLQDEIAMYQNQLLQSKMIIQNNYEQQQLEKQEQMKNKVEAEIDCQILNENDFETLNQHLIELEEQLKNEQQKTQEYERQLNLKQGELDIVKDSTNNSLFSENQNLKNQIKTMKQENDNLNTQVQQLQQYNQEWEVECQKIKAQLDEKEKFYQEQITKIKATNLQQLDKANQDKDRLQKKVEEKDKQIWDLQAKLEQSSLLQQELESQLDKKNKNKNKKKNECMECFKKEAELQTLNAKLLKITNDTTANQNELERQLKQKENQISDGQMLIKSLTLQLQENIQKGGDDPSVKAHISKLQLENDEQSKLIQQLKTNMEKQAAQFMMQLIQQQSQPSPSMSALQTPQNNNNKRK